MNDARKEFINSIKISDDNKRKIKNEPNKSKKWNVRLAAGLAAGLVALGLTGCKDTKEISNPNETNTFTYSQSLTEEEKLENAIKKAEQDYLKIYIEKYNKEYGTEYATWEAEIVTNSIEEGIVYKVGEKSITRGISPALVKQELSKYGTVNTVDGYDKVMQVLVDNKVLGTYSENQEAIISGTQVFDEKFDFNEKILGLKELGIDEELSNAMLKLSAGKGVEDERSLQMRVDEFNKKLNKIKDADIER